MSQALNSLLTLRPFSSIQRLDILALPGSLSGISCRLLSYFHNLQDPLNKFRRILDLSRPPHHIFRLEGEGSVRSLAAILFVATLVVGFVSAGSAAPGTITLVLRESATVRGSEVRLVDVALLKGSDSSMVESLGERIVAQAPAVGRILVLSAKQVLYRAKLNGSGINVRGSLRTRVRRSVRSPEVAEVRAAVKGYVVETTPWTDAEVEIVSVGSLETIDLPYGDISYRILKSDPPHTYRHLVVPVEAVLSGKSVRTFWIKSQIRVHARVVRARRSVPYGKKLESDDLAEAAVNLKDPRREHFRSVEAAIGKIVRRALTTGEPLTAKHLREDYLVRSGDTVRVIYDRHRVHMSSQGRARQNGRLGDVILVKNLEFNRSIRAEVAGDGEVRVHH